MAVITKNDISEINNSLSDIQSELSEKLFLHEQAQDEKINTIERKFNGEVDSIHDKLVEIADNHSNLASNSLSTMHELMLENGRMAFQIKKLEKHNLIINIMVLFWAMVSLTVLLK